MTCSCIIMEYAPDGDLTKVIKKWQAMRRPMPEDLIWRYAIQVARGVAALHSMRILHRGEKQGPSVLGRALARRACPQLLRQRYTLMPYRKRHVREAQCSAMHPDVGLM